MPVRLLGVSVSNLEANEAEHATGNQLAPPIL
jgi:hypothetical protein